MRAIQIEADNLIAYLHQNDEILPAWFLYCRLQRFREDFSKKEYRLLKNRMSRLVRERKINAEIYSAP